MFETFWVWQKYNLRLTKWHDMTIEKMDWEIYFWVNSIHSTLCICYGNCVFSIIYFVSFICILHILLTYSTDSVDKIKIEFLTIEFFSVCKRKLSRNYTNEQESGNILWAISRVFPLQGFCRKSLDSRNEWKML